MDTVPLVVPIKVDVSATLMLVPEWTEAPPRPATTADLDQLGFRHTDALTRRVREVLFQLGLTSNTGIGGQLRSFLDYIVWMEGALDVETVENMQALLGLKPYSGDQGQTEMSVVVQVTVHKDAGNEVPDGDWIPAPASVASEIHERVSDIDLDTGWHISQVTVVP